MAKILHVPSGDEANMDILPCAKMLGELMEEKNCVTEFPDQFVQAIDKETPDYHAIIMLFSDEYPLLHATATEALEAYQAALKLANERTLSKAELAAAQASLASKKTAEERLELYLSTLIYLLPVLPSFIKMDAAVEKVIDIVTRDNLFAGLKLRELMKAYNSFPVHDKTAGMAKKLFFSVLDYARVNGLFKELLPYIPSFEQWIENWKLDDPADKKLLYFLVAAELPRVPEANLKAYLDNEESLHSSQYKSLYWLEKLLQLETELNESSIPAVKHFVKEVILENDLTRDVLDLNNNVLLKKAAEHPELKTMIELLKIIYTSSSLEALEMFLKKNPNIINQISADQKMLKQKVQLLNLISVCSGKMKANSSTGGAVTISLAELGILLKEQEAEELDTLIMVALQYNLLEAKIDQTRGELNVTSVLQRDFGPPDWKDLSASLGEWIAKIDNFLEN